MWLEANLPGTCVTSIGRKGFMGSSSKRQQTMAKRTREQIVKERRAEKLEKRLEKRQAAARGENPVDSPFSTPTVDADGSVSELPSDPSGGSSLET
ncbi:MAG: hypothetical protein E6G67_13995 [Actinobacteria bacterium]|nr:MAG: hypothetical protein E6G67_13995 [Actinomycetota bacterium]